MEINDNKMAALQQLINSTGAIIEKWPQAEPFAFGRIGK